MAPSPSSSVYSASPPPSPPVAVTYRWPFLSGSTDSGESLAWSNGTPDHILRGDVAQFPSIHEPAAFNSEHGSIRDVRDERPDGPKLRTWSHPGTPPRVPSPPQAQHRPNRSRGPPPSAYAQRPQPATRGRAFSNALRQGAKVIGKLARRSSNAPPPSHPIIHVAGFGGFNIPTIDIAQAQAQRAAEIETYRAARAASAERRGDHLYPNVLKPRRRPKPDPVPASAPAPIPVRAPPPAKPRRVRRLSGDSRRMTTFGDMIDAANRSDTSSEAAAASPEIPGPSSASPTPSAKATHYSTALGFLEGDPADDAASWKTTGILKVNVPRGSFDTDSLLDFYTATPPTAPPAAHQPVINVTGRIRRKPVAVERPEPDLNKSLPPTPPKSDTSRDSPVAGNIAQYTDEAFGCADSERDPASPGLQGLANVIKAAQRSEQPTASNLQHDSGSDTSWEHFETRPSHHAQRGRRRRSSVTDDPMSIESQVHDYALQYHWSPAEEAAKVREVYRLNAIVLGRDIADRCSATVDHLVHPGHVSVVVTNQVDDRTVESFREQMPREDRQGGYSDAATDLHERLERERMGLGMPSRRRRA
ncbi:hypothetical protein LTR53_006388 [Teratosphaeriaceae sp. CCFEE 6253]|nr:hypothetical protein LTR53_006388 [Teratosphaeriaceae sp. CCFEE 6253]